jgi:hypothetical protein
MVNQVSTPLTPKLWVPKTAKHSGLVDAYGRPV